MLRFALFTAVTATAFAACVTELDSGHKSTVDVGDDVTTDTIGDVAEHNHAEPSYLAPELCLPPKVLVCHIPPGNPANAHNICIAEPAVQPHIDNHGDYLGLCQSPPEEPPVCTVDDDVCETDEECCSGSCVAGACVSGT